ncbi:MAG: nicotinate phosphoribosyltransferase, partial [Cutibacterium granulosum]
KDGQIVGAEPLARARERHRRSVEELPMSGRRISRGEQAIPTVMVHGEGPDAVLGASLE